MRSYQRQSPMRLPNYQETDQGASLLIVTGVFLFVSLLFVSLFSYVERSSSAIRFETVHTQALYNARMGIDSAAELLQSDTTHSMFTSASGNQTLETQVNQSLAHQIGAPFVAAVTVTPSETSKDANGNTLITLSATITSTGIANGASVKLILDANMVYDEASTESGSGSGGTAGGSGDGDSSSTSAVVRVGSSSPLGCIATTAATCEVSGNGSIRVTGSSSDSEATVTGAPPDMIKLSHTNEIYNNHNFNDPQVVWAEADNVDFNANFNQGGTLIVTGNESTIRNTNIDSGSDSGTMVVTGSYTDISGGNIDGPVYLYGDHETVSANMNCGVIIGGSHVTVDASINNGPVVILGSYDTIDGTVPQAYILGNHDTITGNVNGNAFVVGSFDTLDGNVTSLEDYINSVSVSHVNSQPIEKWNGHEFTVSTSCLGDITISPSASSGSSSSDSTTGVSVTLDFSSTRIGT